MGESEVSTQGAGRKPKPCFGVSAAEFYAALRDKPVRIVTLDGKVYGGLLVGVDQYDIFIKRQSGAVVLIAKHAIKTVIAGAG